MLKLQYLNDPERYTKLSTLPLSIGRDESNAMVVDEPSVSDFHAEISGEDGSLYIVDLLSSSGTLVNEKRVLERSKLTPWDIIRIGTVELEINDPNTCRPGSWVLRTESDLLSSQFYTLHEKTVIGRDPECDLTIDWHLLSRRHAELRVEDDHLRVLDLDSSNGTYINGKKIEDAKAYAGDEIRFDEQQFIVVAPTRRKLSEANDDDRTMLRGDDSDQTQVWQESSPAVGEAAVNPEDDPEETLFVLSAVEDDATRLFVPAQQEKLLPLAFLVLNDGINKGKRIAVNEGDFRIGRIQGNDLVLDEAGISRCHAKISFSGGEWHIEDMGSRNGLQINGELRANRQLQAGDRITLGKTELLFECDSSDSNLPEDAETVFSPCEKMLTAEASSQPAVKLGADSHRKKSLLHSMPGIYIFIGAAALAVGIYFWRSGGF